MAVGNLFFKCNRGLFLPNRLGNWVDGRAWFFEVGLLGLVMLAVLILWQMLGPSELLAVEHEPVVGSIVIMPFAVPEDGDEKYLQNGIRDMLASRLAVQGIKAVKSNQAIVSDLELSQADIQQITASSSAEYLLIGHYDYGDNGARITALVYSVRERNHKRFWAMVRSPGDVMQAVDQLADDIGRQVFSRGNPSVVKNLPTVVRPLPLALPPGYSHNGRLLRAVKERAKFRRSPAFNLYLRSMGVGDLDGDGHDEVVLAGKGRIMVLKGNGFAQITEFNGPPGVDIVYLSMGDLNHNGRPEIYVSATDQKRPESFVLEWRNGNLGYLQKGIPYHLRVMGMIDGQDVLVGQQGTDGDFEAGLYVMRRKNGRLYPRERLTVSGPVNIYNFSFVDVDKDRHPEIILNPQGRLLIIHNDGRFMWERASDVVGPPLDNGLYGVIDWRAALGIRSRLIVRDLHDVRGPEVVTDEPLSSRGIGLRSHNVVRVLAWTGRRPVERWRTPDLEDTVADYQLGRSEEGDWATLYIGVNINQGIMDILSHRQCRVLVYPITKK